jgi:Glycosyl hydrolase catalytic core
MSLYYYLTLMKRFFILIAVSLVCQLSNAQLTIYSGRDQQGASGTCLARTIYTDASIPGGLNDGIISISLSQGYQATLAENADGSGERFSYIASVSNVNANLAFILQNKVSFIRVLRLPPTAVKKKGAGATNNAERDALNVSWYYDWGFRDFSTPTTEFAPMSWNANGALDPNVDRIIGNDTLTHYMAFNEPDGVGQANMTTTAAIPPYKKLLRAGHRMVSPATTESQYSVWLQQFTDLANDDTLRIDVVAVHWYDWGNWLAAPPNGGNANPNPVDVFNRFKAYITNVYNRYKKPIWITEFNANVNRPPAVHEAFMNLALPWLDSDPRVERYAYFFGNDVPARTMGGALTAAGQIYSDHSSVNAYAANVCDARPSLPDAVIASWETSTQVQGGASVTNFAPNYLDTDLTAPSGLVRGAGVILPDPMIANPGYWGGTTWATTAPASPAAPTAATGITANKFLTFSLKSTNGKLVTYTSIDKFKIRIGATGPVQYQIDYQIDNGAFKPCTKVLGPSRTTANFSLGPIDFCIEELQNVPATKTVTFRITPFDASGAASFLFGAGTLDTEADLSIRGFFTSPPPLPIELSNFRSNKVKDKVLLTWETQTEVDFSHFVLERSTNGTAFYDIAKIDGSKRPTGSNYNHTDDTPDATTTNYYRLKMVDVDGSFGYSNILSESFEASDALLTVYPSVSTGNKVEAVFKEVSEAAQLKVFSSTGQLLIMYNFSAGATTQTIDIEPLAKGTYFLILQDRSTIQSRKFVKQ